MIYLLICVSLTFLFCLRIAAVEQPPEWIIRGIAAVETGAHWSSPGEIKLGQRGPDLGPWQISRAVAKELGASSSRLQACHIYAEKKTVAHLTKLHARLGDWREVAKAWRAGVNGRHKKYAIEYAERVENYGRFYEKNQ